MSSDKLSASYRNPNGILTYKFLWDLKKSSEEEIEQFLKEFRVTEVACPPEKIRPKGILCFHCKDCFLHAIEEVKLKDVKKEEGN